MITTERYERVIARSKRKELAEKQNQISQTHCMKCPHFSESQIDNCANCPFLNDLEMIGDRYTIMANKRREIKKQRLLAEARESGLTPSKYIEMRLHGLYDAEIQQGVGLSVSMFSKWKKALGLIGKTKELEI